MEDFLWCKVSDRSAFGRLKNHEIDTNLNEKANFGTKAYKCITESKEIQEYMEKNTVQIPEGKVITNLIFIFSLYL